MRFGHNEAKLIFTLERDGRTLFTPKDAQAVLATSKKSVYRVLDRLKAKRRIRQVRKGLYLLSPAKSGIEGAWTEHVFAILTGLVGKDYYVGFWSALSYWGMTEQVPRTTYVTVMKRARALTFDSQRIQFVTYPRRRFFDYTHEKIGEAEFNISGREKTIVDSLAHPEYSGGISEVAKAIWTARDELDTAQMIDDAEKMRIHAAKLRLGYLLELLDFDAGAYSSLLPRKPTGVPWLDPSATKKAVAYSNRWGLKLNVPRDIILHWK